MSSRQVYFWDAYVYVFVEKNSIGTHMYHQALCGSDVSFNRSQYATVCRFPAAAAVLLRRKGKQPIFTLDISQWEKSFDSQWLSFDFVFISINCTVSKTSKNCILLVFIYHFDQVLMIIYVNEVIQTADRTGQIQIRGAIRFDVLE